MNTNYKHDSIENGAYRENAVKKALGAVLFLISFGMIVYSAFLCKSNDIWYDELFSMEFAGRPISEIIKLTAADVHPPLYYIILHKPIKVLTMLGFSPVMVAKTISVVPFALLWLYAAIALRNRYGLFLSGLFSVAVIGMPNMSEYTVEIRMYSLVIFFITAMCIHARPFIEKDPEKQIKGLKWNMAFPLFAYGLLACYTQYYAAVAVAAIYLFLVIWSIRKNIWQLGILLISGNLTLVCFFPWIGKVISQASTVASNYWIQDLTWRSLGGVVKYLVLPAFSSNAINVTAAVILAVLMFVVVIRNIRNEYMWLCFSPIIGIVVFGFAVSFIMRPIFVYRYMLPGMGAFWLGITLAAGKAINGDDTKQDEADNRGVRAISRYLAAALVAVMVVVGIRDYWAFRGNELYRKVNMTKTQELFRTLHLRDDLVIICNFDHVEGLTAYYMNDFKGYTAIDFLGKEINLFGVPVKLYGSEPEPLIKEMVEGTGSIEDGAAIKKYLENGETVLFFGSFNSREDLVKEWLDTYGIKNENKGSYLLERYWFDVYELHL